MDNNYICIVFVNVESRGVKRSMLPFGAVNDVNIRKKKTTTKNKPELKTTNLQLEMRDSRQKKEKTYKI